MSTDTQTARERLEATITRLGLTITSEFVPWSRSRHAKPQPTMMDRNLNWRITLHHNERPVLTTNYSAGIGHCPSYNQREAQRPSLDFAEKIARETETGVSGLARKPIRPDSVDVIQSLVLDADVLNYNKYEEWAPELGLDPDSRKGYSLYLDCMETALSLRNAIGDAGLQALQEAGRDY